MIHATRRQFVHGVGVVGFSLVAGCGPWRPVVPVADRNPEKLYRVGVLDGVGVPGPETLLAALSDMGYREGQDLLKEPRRSSVPGDQAGYASDLVARQVDVIVTSSASGAAGAAAASTTMPIVNAAIVGADLVAAGLADSLARPGRNVTGLTTYDAELIGKRLQLLTEMAPGASRLAVIAGGGSPLPDDIYAEAAKQLGVEVQLLVPRDEAGLERVFEDLTRDPVNGLEVRGGPITILHRARVLEFARQRRLPAIGDTRSFVEDGGLLAYTPRYSDLWRRAATYVDRILKGANPAELPIQRPSTFDLLLNLQTAQALGVTIHPSVLLQATEVIQ